MRGRTNVNGVGELAVNGDVRQFEVAEGASVVAGDFMEMIYNPQFKTLLQQSGNVDFIYYISENLYVGVMADGIRLFDTINGINIMDSYTAKMVYGIVKISENLFLAECQLSRVTFRITDRKIIIINEYSGESNLDSDSYYYFVDMVKKYDVVLTVVTQLSKVIFTVINLEDFSSEVSEVLLQDNMAGKRTHYFGSVENTFYFACYFEEKNYLKSYFYNISFANGIFAKNEEDSTSDSNFNYKVIWPMKKKLFFDRFEIYVSLSGSSYIYTNLVIRDIVTRNTNLVPVTTHLDSERYPNMVAISELNENNDFLATFFYKGDIYGTPTKCHVVAFNINPVTYDITIKSSAVDSNVNVGNEVCQIIFNVKDSYYSFYDWFRGSSSKTGKIYVEMLTYKNGSVSVGNPQNIVRRYTGAINPFGIAKETGRSGQRIDVFVPPSNPR